MGEPLHANRSHEMHLYFIVQSCIPDMLQQKPSGSVYLQLQDTWQALKGNSLPRLRSAEVC